MTTVLHSSALFQKSYPAMQGVPSLNTPNAFRSFRDSTIKADDYIEQKKTRQQRDHFVCHDPRMIVRFVEDAHDAARQGKPRLEIPTQSSILFAPLFQICGQPMTRQATKKKEEALKPAVREQLPKSKGRKKRAPRLALASVAVEPQKERIKKEKVVRDTFTMPRSDYEKIAVLRQRCLDEGVIVNKSELLRAALFLLEAASQERLLAAVSAVEKIKTGRPPKSH